VATVSEEFTDTAAHGAPGAPPGPLRGQLNITTIIAGILVAVIMGLSYPYMVLKLGFGPNVSVVAAFFGFLFLRLFDLAMNRRGYDRWQNNLTEAAGTSAAQTAFMCVLLGAFDILAFRSKGQFAMHLDPIESFLWLWSACTLGVLLAVPLRRHFVVDEKLPYVDGLSAAETLIVLDPPRDATAEIRANAMRAFKAVMWGLGLSGLLMLVREDAKLLPWIPEGWDAPWHYLGRGLRVLDAAGKASLDDKGLPVMAMTGVVLANLGVGVSYSLLSIGSGMLVGLRINISMMLGGVLAWVVMPYFLVSSGVLPETPTRTQVLFWVMWPATGMLVAGGLTALALRWRILVETFRSLRTASIGSDEFPLSIVIIGVVLSATALCIVQASLLDMPVWMTLTAIVLSLPLMLVGLRVLGETNWGPISALSNMMQGVFAALAPGNITANMVASGTTGTIATSSEAIMQDYKCGEIIGTKPRNLTIMQLIAVPVGAAAVAWMYPALVKAFGITGDHAQLSSPISNKWAGFAELLRQGVSALPTSAMWALLIFSVLGVVLTVLETVPSIKKWVPSPTGIGIGIIVPFSVVFTMFLGGIMGSVWERTNKKSADAYMVPLASGLIAGEALVAVIASIYLAAVA
jgi:uncharacterized oligopeptide transporter (OPT) family protein